MDVAAINQTPTKTAATSTAKQANDKNYDTFLKMMTTQIKNQDPLNPMSADQLAVQLATFSGVEQQTKTNDLLSQMLGQNTLAGMSQMVGWVGKEARLAGPAYFDGSTPVTVSPNPAASATRAVLVAKDQSGKEVSRTELPLGSADYAWQGRDSLGNALPKGVYALSLESYQGDTLLGATDVEYYGKISEIRSTANGVSAMLPGGVEALTSLITAIPGTRHELKSARLQANLKTGLAVGTAKFHIVTDERVAMIEYASNRVPLKRLCDEGGVLAVITEIVGTSYRNLGTMMAFGPQGQRTGSLSSGCIEDDIAEHAATALKTGQVRALRYGQGSPFFDLKLPCGGGLSILLIPNPDRATLQSIIARGDERAEAPLRINLTTGALTLLEVGQRAAGPGDLLIVLEPELRFWVYGHGIEAMSFALMAQAAGYDVTLFGQEGLQTDLSRIGPLNISVVASFRSYVCPKPDRRTAITLFFHDHDNEARLLAQFLPSEALFIGAQGSLKARQRLLTDLNAHGVKAEHIARLCPNFGLIELCRDPRTLAVSVLAHVLSLAGNSVSAYAMTH